MRPALALLLAALAGTGENVEGKLRLHEFHSKTFQNTRMLRVLLPGGTTHRRTANGAIRCCI